MAPKARILVVDDEPVAASFLERLLQSEGYATETASNGQIALEKLEEQPRDLVLTDLNMPTMNGMALLEEIRQKRSLDVPVIMITSESDLAVAVQAMRAGAANYLTKPVNADEVLVSVERALQVRDLQIERENLSRQLRERDAQGLHGLVGASAAMQKVYAVATRVAPSRATVLITGESGTGKGELARAIHNLSPRSQKPLISLHCASLAESLLESELFGHEKGAFTGAEKKRLGRFEQANGGTLFLDEIGEVPMSMQVKLLKVLQERTFERVGGNESVRVDVRLIAATNRDLAAEVAAGRFREDLFYRLNVVHVDMPPLRSRGGDALVLANHFLEKFAAENFKRVSGFSPEAKTKIVNYRWPGNVRALENAIERAVVMCEGDTVGVDDLPFEAIPENLGGLRIPGATLAEVEKYAILTTLEAVDGSTAKAAEILDMSIRTIQYRLHEYGIAKDRR